MGTVAESNYTDFNLRISTSAQFTEDVCLEHRLTTEPKNRLFRYFDADSNLGTFFEELIIQEGELPFNPKEAEDPLRKYKELLHKIDFSEIGSEEDKMKEETRLYFDLVDYRKRATTVSIDGKQSEIQKCD